MSESPDLSVYSSQRWLESIHASRRVDVSVAESYNPIDTLIGSVVEGRSIAEQLDAQHLEDPGVAVKNRFLGLLAVLSDDEQYQVGDLLALLDRQAESVEPADETRYRQFIALWHLAVALSKDEALLAELRNQS